MSVEENKAVAKRWNEEIVSGRKLEAFGEVLAENYVNYKLSDSSWSPGIQGLERAKEVFGEGLAEYPTYRVSVDDIIGEGDKVAARLTGFLEGKPFRKLIVFYRFSDGKIVEDWYCDAQIQY